MLKDGIAGNAAKQQAAEAFMNFVSRPDNVVRNMYYIGYTSVIAGGDSDIIFAYADWCYRAEDDAGETIEYPTGAFFTGDAEDPTISSRRKPISHRQLYAQYPPQEVLDRAVVMQYFDKENNQKINQMWVNVRCFDLTSLTASDWGVILAAAAAFLIAGIWFMRRFWPRKMIRRKDQRKEHEKISRLTAADRMIGYIFHRSLRAVPEGTVCYNSGKYQAQGQRDDNEQRGYQPGAESVSDISPIL